MLYHLHQETESRGDNQTLGWLFSHRLYVYLSPFLVELDSYLDRRLVRTFYDLIGCMIRFRDRHNGLVLSELGGYLLGPMRAAAGTKRISNLFRSKKWSHHFIDDYLLKRARARIEQLLEKGIRPLLLWDDSVVEKAESWHSEGLCAVRSSKARRLKRIKPGYYSPPGGTVHVPGFHWLGVLLSGLHIESTLVAMRWWSSRGKYATDQASVGENLLKYLIEHLPQGLIHVLDRGYAGRPWIRRMFKHNQQFILRWPTRFKLTDLKGQSKNAWKFSVGRKAMSKTRIYDAPRKTHRWIRMLYLPVTHPDWPEKPLFLVISRPGKGKRPWYLLTNMALESKQHAWEIIFSYAKRWKIEQAFRFAKTEMAMESPRLWFWENRLKCMAMIALAFDFLLSILSKGRTPLIEKLLKTYCHRTGNRCRNVSAPIYRLRLALSHAWNYWLIQNSG